MKKLVSVALLFVGAVLVSRLVAAKKSEWDGLTEADVREKLETRVPKRVPEDKRAMIADGIVSRMHQRGVLREEDQFPSATAGQAQRAADSNEPDRDDGTESL